MNIALLGYGRMGKVIERVAAERGHSVLLKVDVENRSAVSDVQLKACDVAIDFTVAAVAPGNYRWCFDNGVPVVSGTTGWLKEWEDVSAYCKAKDGSFFYASNFSIGMNLFFRLNKELARIMDKFRDYRVSVEEVHHVHKLDAPSGTAITLSEGVMENHSAYSSWQLTDGKETAEGVVPVTAFREGEVPGIHSVVYESAIDKISIRHEAFSREGLALGAVLAAEFLVGKKGVFGMEELMRRE